MPHDPLDHYIGQLVSKYQYPDKVKRDIYNAVNQYKNLTAKLDTYVFNDGSRQELVSLEGTIPVMYKGACYNIPVCVWILDTHPYNSPICYVKPTSTMQIKISRHVDTNGRIYLPYLHHWQPNTSDLLGLIQVMIIVFGETPPVYSRPKVHESSTNPPYPPAQPSNFMPMPNVGTPYPPYPPQPLGGATPYPPSTAAYPSYTGGGYPSGSNYNFGGYNSSSGVPTANSYPSVTTTGYPPVPPTSTASTIQQEMNSVGTLSEEHIHASLLSAVEDKLKKKLCETLTQYEAEIEVLKQTQDDLTKGKNTLEDIFRRLQEEQVNLDKNMHILQTKNEEMNELLTKIENQGDVDVDEAVVPTAPLYRQLLSVFAEENATEDAIYYLGEALRKGVIDLDLFLKHVRQISRKQFMLRALMQKCRQKANLPH